MTGRTAAQAVTQFQERIRQTFSCVTRAVPESRGGYHVSAAPHVITLGTGHRVRLAGPSRFHIRFVHYYQIVVDREARNSYRVVTTSYFYSLDDADQQEIIAFHWHPSATGSVSEPHLHLGPGARIGYDLLHRAHIPTGHITIQDVMLLAINDLDVEPLIDREAALQRLIETRRQ